VFTSAGYVRWFLYIIENCNCFLTSLINSAIIKNHVMMISKENIKGMALFIALNLILFCLGGDVNAKPVSEAPADSVLIEKKARKLTLYREDEAIRTYRIALGDEPVGKKECQGDNRTPEGRYVINGRNSNSKYHMSLRISYPNSDDRKRAKKLGCKPGGDIMIHGLPNGSGLIGKLHIAHDWTLGCIAVTNEEIEEIWRLVPNGTEVVIKP
jgi:murein L,D-transpeptidase YafK